MADLGSGTGKLTRPLAATGAHVIAVEPLDEMRAELERRVPAAEAVAATAEELPLADASVDAVTAGQAFHWFDVQPALREIARVLRPEGALALVWNIRVLADPVERRIDELLREVRDKAPSEREQPWRGEIASSTLFGPLEERSFAWEALYTRDELADRVASVSFVAQLTEQDRGNLLDRVRSAAGELPEPFSFGYRTDVFVYPRSGA